MIKDLVTSADIKAIYDKILSGNASISNDELVLYNESTRTESQIQIACNITTQVRYGYLKDCSVNFVQIDNGSRSGILQKKKKKAEGTAKGFPDAVIWIYRKLSQEEYLADRDLVYPIAKKHIFIEFKRIGEYKITPEQQAWHDFHKKWHESAYFCNNTVFFEKVICKEIDDFLKIN